MAEIYDRNGNCLACGLQSGLVCDEAIGRALSMAAERGEEVMLEDGEVRTTVYPDGSQEDDWDGDWPDGSYDDDWYWEQDLHVDDRDR